MRNKRMFSLDVVDTDRFLEMPATTQALYFHLGMRADDDGFISSPNKIVGMVNCSVDDFKLLQAKGYVIPFTNGIVVITHWNQNNYLRKDRYTETRYKSEKAMLQNIDSEYVLETVENRALSTSGIPSGNPVTETVTETEKICSQKADERESDFEKIYKIYPKKRGRTKAFDNYLAWLKGKSVHGKKIRLTNRQMYLAVQKYVEQQEVAGVELEFYKNFDTLMGIQLLDFVEVENE